MRGVVLAMAALMGAAGPAAGQQGGVARSDVRLDAAQTQATALRAAALLEERYVDPSLGARYAAALRTRASRGDYAGIVDRAALAARLTADLQAVKPDGHLRFYPAEPPAPSPPDAAPPVADDAAATDPHRVGFRDIGWAAPGVAYLSFEHFDDRPAALAILRRFFTDHGDARALVIDSRGNHGGGFDMLGIIANQLFARPRHLADMDMARAVVETHGVPFPVDGTVLRRIDRPPHQVRFEHWAAPSPDPRWFAKPVFYLTSHETFSAAEHLAMVLKSTGRATLIGETTGGGNHFGGTEPVGSGLELFVPIGHTTDPQTGRDWEGVGIAPDVTVPAASALDEALRRIAAGA